MCDFRVLSGPVVTRCSRTSQHHETPTIEDKAESRGRVVGSQVYTGRSCLCTVNGENDPTETSLRRGVIVEATGGVFWEKAS